MIQMNLQNRLKDFENKLIVAGGKGKLGSLGYVHTAVFKMSNQQGPTVQHVELCSVLRGSLYERGLLGRMDTCICMTEFLHYSHETTTILSISYIPMQNVFGVKKLKFLKRDLMETSITTCNQILLEPDS